MFNQSEVPKMRKQFILFIGFAVISCCTANSLARTWYIMPDGTGDAPTIQAAIDSTMSGDTILVAAGTYEQTYIVCFAKDSLTITSEEGAEQTILHLDGSSAILIVNNVNYLFIRGFTFENSAGVGLGIEWSTNVIVEENIFRNNQNDAIFIGDCGDITISNNLIYSNYNGIYCIDVSNNITISQNTISYNDIASGAEIGVGVKLDPNGSYTLLNNIITDNEYGVLSSASAINFSCNNVYNNTINYALVFLPDPTGSNGNISVLPQFCGSNPEVSGNFYLQEDSPCAPKNHPYGYQCELIGKYPIGCATEGIEENSWSGIKGKFK